VLKTGVIEFPIGRSILAQPRQAHHESADRLADLPVLPETLLALELQLQNYTVDLHEFAEVVLADLGATIQLLRMAGREYGYAEDRLTRIEDCICDFGPTACFESIARGGVARNYQRQAVSQLWAHARQIALNARHLAATIPWAISPDQAYLAGLLHSVGTLPPILGWDWSEASHDYPSNALKLAERWAFPSYLRDLFCEMLMPGYNPQWSELITEAHRLCGAQKDRCALYDAVIRPSA